MSADPLLQLADWAAPLLAKLSPTEQRKLTRLIAQDLRRSQARRIAQQQNPDGSGYEPRRANKIRERKGGIKAMFVKMRSARHLRAQSTASEATVGISGRAARIARIHQEGLRDQVQPGGPSVIYPRRELLGLSDDDTGRVRDWVTDRV